MCQQQKINLGTQKVSWYTKQHNSKNIFNFLSIWTFISMNTNFRKKYYSRRSIFQNIIFLIFLSFSLLLLSFCWCHLTYLDHNCWNSLLYWVSSTVLYWGPRKAVYFYSWKAFLIWSHNTSCNFVETLFFCPAFLLW